MTACLNLFDTFSKENTGEQQAACAAENVKMQKGASFCWQVSLLQRCFGCNSACHPHCPAGHAVRSTYCARKRLAAKPSHLSTWAERLKERVCAHC